MAHGTVRFYFDYISSNAYLAWTQLPKLCDRYAFTIEPVPVLFAGLLEAHGQLGPAEIPAKALWTAKNNVRKAVLLDVPLNPPAFHPFNPLLALRVSSVPLDGAARRALIGALFDAVWVHGLHVSDPVVVERLGDELFWGYDDFPYLELCLAGKDPLDSGQWQKWFSAPGPSAVRRRFR